MDVLLLGSLIERFVDRVLVCRGSPVVVDVLVGKFHRTLGGLKMAREIQTRRWGIPVLMLLQLLLLDLLLVLLGEILQKVLLQMIVGNRRIKLLPKGESLLLVCKGLGSCFNLCLDFLPL